MSSFRPNSAEGDALLMHAERARQWTPRDRHRCGDLQRRADPCSFVHRPCGALLEEQEHRKGLDELGIQDRLRSKSHLYL